MIEFFAGHLASAVSEIAEFEEELRIYHQDSVEVEDVCKTECLAHLERLERQCKKLFLKPSLHRIWSLKRRIGHNTGSTYISREKCSSDILQVELRELRGQIVSELWERFFVYIPEDHVQYSEFPRKGSTEHVPLFGNEVHEAFPSARQDIKDAGNCLAVDLSTGAVFHLMRVAEYGLRALAWDRRIKVPKGPVELASWDDIIKELEKAEQAIQGYPKTLAREAQFEFYHGAMMEFKRFKNLFRNRVMHTREDYDWHQAKSAFDHVKEFMNILASSISEKRRTPAIWRKA